MVQWFRSKFQSQEKRILKLSYDSLVESKQKSLERLARFKGEASFQLFDDLLFTAYQLELIGIHRVKTTEPTDLARHLGRVDAIHSLMRLIGEVKSVVIQKEIRRQDEMETKRARSFSRPVI